MDPQAVRQLIEDIREAFRDVERGGGTTLHEARAIDDWQDDAFQSEARKLDRDEHWWEIPEGVLESLGGSFGFLDAEGARYYLPAIMIYHLEHPDRDDLVGFSAVYYLSQRDRIEAFSLYNETQSKIIARYLQLLSLDWRADCMTAESAAAGLRKYWGRFLPGS